MPPDANQRYARQSNRLSSFDYSSAGGYFITVCTSGRKHSLGTIIDGRPCLSPAGTVVENTWLDIEKRFPAVTTGAYVVMPDHFHGIVIIDSTTVFPSYSQQDATTSLSQVMRAFKSISAISANKVMETSGQFWQRNYYEHVIRNEAELSAYREYIADNPRAWAEHERPAAQQ